MTTEIIIALIICGFLVAFTLLGFPLAAVMLGCGIVGIYLISGPQMIITQLTSGIYTLTSSYNFAVIPLFMVMGSLTSVSGIAEGTFKSARTFLGRTRGGLLDTVVVANAIFGACSGVSSAGNVVFARIALPEMEKAGYDRGLSIGTIQAAGSLSALIPPSVPILTTCLLTGVSIGASLMTGVASGILFAVVMIIVNKVYTLIKPDRIPAKSTVKIPVIEKLKSLRFLAPIILLFALIVGGSFLGWFPATVAGAVAVVAVLIYCLIIRMPVKTILHTLWEGIIGFGNLYLIMVAGQFFGRFISLSGLATWLATTVAGLPLGRFIIFTIVVIFYIFVGMFMECLSIIIITVPIVYPLLTALGFHPLVIVMFLVIIVEAANLTPPIGLGVFVTAGVLGESPTFIFKNVTKYFVMEIILIYLMCFIPDLVEWLPRLLGYTIL